MSDKHKLSLDERHNIERVMHEKGVEALDDVDLVALLRDRYRPEPTPGPCPVCGDERTIAATGPGPMTWACSPLEDDPDRPHMLRYKPNRGTNASSRAEDAAHYRQSQTYQYRTGDSLVYELLNRFDLDE